MIEWSRIVKDSSRSPSTAENDENHIIQDSHKANSDTSNTQFNISRYVGTNNGRYPFRKDKHVIQVIKGGETCFSGKFIQIEEGMRTRMEDDDHETVLLEIVTSSSVEGVGENHCSLCRLPSSVKYESGFRLPGIENWAFGETGLIDIIILRSPEVSCVGCISTRTFLSSITFESRSGLSWIGKWVFNETGLIEIILPASVEILGDRCFSERSSLSPVIFESRSKVSRIEEWAFSEAGLVEIIILLSIEVLDEHCFAWCKSLGQESRFNRPVSGNSGIKKPLRATKVSSDR
jgi:hypothetical protein